jgi:hypothetical protein
VIVLVGLVLGLMMAARLVTGGWAGFLTFIMAVCGIISVTWFLRLVAACRGRARIPRPGSRDGHIGSRDRIGRACISEYLRYTVA